MSRTAILWFTHVWTEDIEAEFERLRKLDRPGAREVWLLLDARTPGADALTRRYPRTHVFHESVLMASGYPTLPGRGLMHHPHFPLLDFFRARPDYERYWTIEYDVRYTGDWATFVESLDAYPHDFVTSHVRRFADEPRWFWWDSLRHPTDEIARADRLRSFNVAYRMSNRALRAIDAAQLAGWQGYAEVLLPTLLQRAGLTILDFGGDGPFTPADLRRRHYSSHHSRSGVLTFAGTMRFRPARARAGRAADVLYHPVKPAAMQEGLGARLRIAGRWALETVRDRW